MWAFSLCAGALLGYLVLFSILTVRKRDEERAEREWREYLNGRK